MSPQIALVAGRLGWYEGGGSVQPLATVLSEIADVTLVTSAAAGPAWGVPADLSRGVGIIELPEEPPDNEEEFLSPAHAWSAKLLDALREAYGPTTPDLIEFGDRHGEGMVTIQARRSLDRALEATRVCVRLWGSAEMSGALNGHLDRSFQGCVDSDLERYCLRYADALLAPSGDVLPTYRSFYRGAPLAPAIAPARVPVPLPSQPNTAPPAGGPLRLIYVGPLERRHGLQNLLRAITGIPNDDVHLTLAGPDTHTGPLGAPLREQLELMGAGDPRIAVFDWVTPAELPALVHRHHVVLMPSLWACWPTAALQVLALNRPIIATPVGGLREIVEPGVNGWLARGTDAAALGDAIDQSLRMRERIDEMIDGGAPHRRAVELTAPERVLAAYDRLLATSQDARRRTPAPSKPLVSAIVPYFKLEAHIEEAVRSLSEQSYERLEIIVVNDGSFRQRDEVLEDLAARYSVRLLTQPNSGLGAARNAGVAQSRGRYVFPLDADNAAEPTFVERCIAVLESHPDIAFVTSWLRMIDAHGRDLGGSQGWASPLGNFAAALTEGNVAGDAAAVIRRGVFDRGFAYSQDLTSFEDWLFYRRLRERGLMGHVIPERLLRYRVREQSMVRQIGLPSLGRLAGEMEARLSEGSVRWT
jgi:glycogen synthase